MREEETKPSQYTEAISGVSHGVSVRVKSVYLSRSGRRICLCQCMRTRPTSICRCRSPNQSCKPLQLRLSCNGGVKGRKGELPGRPQSTSLNGGWPHIQSGLKDCPHILALTTSVPSTPVNTDGIMQACTDAGKVWCGLGRTMCSPRISKVRGCRLHGLSTNTAHEYLPEHA